MRITNRYPILLVGVIGLIFLPLWTFVRKDRGEELFKQHVLNTQPQSVTDIRVDQARQIFGYGYVFRFRISKPDVALIVGSRPFQRVENTKYEPWGELHFEWSPVSWDGLAVYPTGTSKPDWFAPEEWQDPEAYAFEEKSTRQSTYILLYNEQAQEAYFFAFRGD
ncbi:MAG TPA: hypothetical protein PKZ07_02465 [Sedimentisphaerales bacterium]|nr:hypothetical protein [Sedimentisphaerales bacterium]